MASARWWNRGHGGAGCPAQTPQGNVTVSCCAAVAQGLFPSPLAPSTSTIARFAAAWITSPSALGGSTPPCTNSTPVIAAPRVITYTRISGGYRAAWEGGIRMVAHADVNPQRSPPLGYRAAVEDRLTGEFSIAACVRAERRVVVAVARRGSRHTSCHEHLSYQTVTHRSIVWDCAPHIALYDSPPSTWVMNASRSSSD